MASGDATLMYSFPQWHPLNQPSPMINCHRVQINRKKHRKKRKKTCFCYSSKLGCRSTCNTIIAMFFFLILIVVITIAALAIYIGMEIILDGSLRVTYGDSYTSELYNRSSQLFHSKSNTYKIMVEKVFARSTLGPAIKQCIIMGFKNGSLLVFYRLILDRRKIPSRLYTNLEDTAKKILFEEITSFKPLIFNNIRLDPKQIIVRKHALNAETQTESYIEETLEEATVSSLNNALSSLKRGPHTTPAILRRRNPTLGTSPFPPSAPTTDNNTKKHRQPTVEKSSKLKLQLDSTKSPPTTTSKTSTKKIQNFDVNDKVNRYSFVSDDTLQINNIGSSENSSQVQGFGEAEVIIVPATPESKRFLKDEDVTNEKLYQIKSHKKPFIFSRNATSTIDKLPSRPNQQVYHNRQGIFNGNKMSEQSHRGNTTDKNAAKSNENKRSDEDFNRNLLSNLPTRSNIAVIKPVRSKGNIYGNVVKMSTITLKMEDDAEWKNGTLQTTEDAVIVLNTEVVTSTSMQVSYGQETFQDDLPNSKNSNEDNSKNSNEDNSKIVTHNLQSLTEMAGPQITHKYKNIFPRSIRDDYEEGIKTRPKHHRDLHLSLLIEKYKKQPSNESLNLIIQQLASIYVKNTTQVESLKPTTKPSLLKSSYNGLLMTRPMNKISTNATPPTVKSSTEVFTIPTVCPGNVTRKCDNGQCISEHLWCNQFADCSDRSDESKCTCADYLKAQFSYQKICDGVVDCWDFSDEKLCEWCSPNMYVCINAKLCINQNKVCDGNRDCPLGDDEKNCITISQFKANEKNFTYQSTGVITVKRAGIWGKLCFKKERNESNEQAIKKLTHLGKAVCKTMTYRNFVNISIVDDLETSNLDTIYYKLANITANNSISFRKKNFKFVKTSCESTGVVQVSCDNLECGLQTQVGKLRTRGKYLGERRSRIVGGGSATHGAWPWQAALYKEGEFQCGATLISNKWLLSAGHCFNNAQRDYWVARLGILRRSSTLPSPHEQIRPINRIVVHPYYADADFVNDISLLEMSSEVYVTNFVRPICLPDANSILLDGTLCTVIGWGQIMETGSIYPDTLQEVQLPVISPHECRKQTIFLPLYKVTDGMLCAGFERGGRDACLGDSGGPLMCQGNNTWHLVGVTSNGNGCARANRPGVYTKVTNYLNWINNHIETSSNGNTSRTAALPICNGYRCPLGECLPKARVCNGYMECSDGSDEQGC